MNGDIYEKIAVYCDKNQLFVPEDGVIIGLSGGADSVFLLTALVQLQKRWQLKLRAVHVNHNIRGDEALRDQQFAVAFAEKLGVTCEVEQADIPFLSKEWQMSEEEAGRTYRYRCFEEWRKKLGYQKIAVAHHRDDQAETILFQLLRGSGLRGLGGMRPKRDKIVRPLLETGRGEIEQALQEQEIAFCTDSTNGQTDYARNMLRLQVMPYLREKLQPAAAEHIAQTGAYLREIMDYIDEEVDRIYKQAVLADTDGLAVSEEVFVSLSGVLQRELILRMIQKLAGKRKDITSVHVEQVRSVFLGTSGKFVMLPYELRARKSYGTLVLYKENMAAEKSEKWEEKITLSKRYMLKIQKEVSIPVVFEKILRENLSADILKNHCTKCFDYAKMVTMPMLRYPQEGDFLWLDATGKTKKLSRLFIDEKIEKTQRERTIVLAEGHHILWVPALARCSAYYYVSEDTREVVLAKLGTDCGYV